MSPTKTAPKKPAAKAEAKAEVPSTARPNYEALADRVAAELEAGADLHTANTAASIHHPAHVSRNAIDLFGKHRYNPAFKLILEAAYKDGHAYGRGDA